MFLSEAAGQRRVLAPKTDQWSWARKTTATAITRHVIARPSKWLKQMKPLAKMVPAARSPSARRLASRHMPVDHLPSTPQPPRGTRALARRSGCPCETPALQSLRFLDSPRSGVDGASLQNEPLVDAIFEAGCHDATVGQVGGIQYVDLDREAERLGRAIISAVRDLEKVDGVQVTRVVLAEPLEAVLGRSPTCGTCQRL